MVGKEDSMCRGEKITWTLMFVTIGIIFFFFVYPGPRSKEGKITTTKGVSTDNFFKKMEAELETVKNGDILETRLIGVWEGTGARLVVITRDSEEGRVNYQVKGGSVFLQSSSELARRIVRVYRVGTPEWREQTEAFMKQ